MLCLREEERDCPGTPRSAVDAAGVLASGSWEGSSCGAERRKESADNGRWFLCVFLLDPKVA